MGETIPIPILKEETRQLLRKLEDTVLSCPAVDFAGAALRDRTVVLTLGTRTPHLAVVAVERLQNMEELQPFEVEVVVVRGRVRAKE